MVTQLLAQPRRPHLRAENEGWSRFEHSLERVEFRRGDVMLQLGSPTDELFVIREGKAKTCCASAGGHELVLDFHCAGDVLVEPALFDSAPAVSTTTAITDVQVGRIAREDLTRWLALCPDVVERLLGCIARGESRSHEMRTDMAQLDTAARLAKALLHLSHRFSTGRHGMQPVVEDLTQEELGQYIGSRRDTVNKTLSCFAQRGWIRVERRNIVLTRPAQLSRRIRVGTVMPTSHR
ncbi:Crp/Fnr family transcriptional regulator [Lentzea albida]|uniref:Crp/Fnr family transcriptional regulator n=1 Tax=Lentzea albida TaxID=65499 RepID=UPI0011601CF2|nr:Crp/Fnr family transcriptional regulator [Lentzea albida]